MLRWLLLATLLLSAAAEDFVFRVPEIQVRHAAADRPVGTTRRHVKSDAAADQLKQALPGSARPRSAPVTDVLYEEYFVEHDVSAPDARRAAQTLVLDDVPPAGCGTCGRREQQYCVSHAMADHCCCDRRFLREPYPWVPHTCYLGPARCRPHAADCATYARLRDCCCLQHQARKWKGILSGSGAALASPLAPVLLTVLPSLLRQMHVLTY